MSGSRIRAGRGAGWVVVLAVIGSAWSAPSASGDPVAPAEPTREFKILARNWSFTPDRVIVPVGTRVVLHVESLDSPHSFELKAYRLEVPLPQGETTTIEFVARKAGTFRWRCGRPCGNGCPKMSGELVVTEPTPER